MFTASSYSACSIRPWSSMSLSTMLRSFSESSWFSGIEGSRPAGFLVMAAMVADCTRFRSLACTLKYRCAAVSTPYRLLDPNWAMFRYPCRISGLEYIFSICTAISISRSLRAIVLSCAWYSAIGSLSSRACTISTFLTYCWVSDEPPCISRLSTYVCMNARMTPCTSTPECSKKRRSSRATIAFCMYSDTSLIGTTTRFCE